MMGLFLSVASAKTTILVVVWALFAGLSVATVMLWLRVRILGRAVRALLEKEGVGPEHALSAEVLGIDKNPLILRAIRKGSLARYIKILPPAKTPDGEAIASNDAAHESGAGATVTETTGERYYLDEEKKVQADLRYAGKGADLYVVILALVLYLLVALLAARFLPMLAEEYLSSWL